MKKEKDKILLGVHMTTEGGLHNAIIKGNDIDCTTIQIFTKNNRQWKSKELSSEEINQFHINQKKYEVLVVSHCSYLINLASPNTSVRERSFLALKEEVLRCNELSIPYAILHPGSKLEGKEEEALQWIAEGIDKALESSNKKTSILLETMAGQGSSVGSTLEQLAKILSFSKNKDCIGICVDTCHLFASGYKFSNKNDYIEFWKNFDQIIGLQNLKCIHLNDSKRECGSKVDRHEEIGKGEIGLEAFELVMNDSKFKDIPKILETPKATMESDINNLKLLKSLLLKK